MSILTNLPADPYAILDPNIRWRPGAETSAPATPGQGLPPLVAKVREAVKAWRDAGYPDISETSRALLCWWFERDEDGDAMRYYFAQREAVESVIFLYEKAKVPDKYNLLPFASGGNVSLDMMPEEWRRYVIKMATGSGKTKVISLLIAWSYFHKLYESGSPLSRNTLLIAPNIIVLDRLYRDFEGGRIFREDNVIPPNEFEGRDWQSDFRMNFHRQNEVRGIIATGGNLFLTNIHRVFMRDKPPPSADDEDSSDYFLGPKPVGALTDNKIDLGAVIRNLDELLIINDEAHHIHDENLAWFNAIREMHNALAQKGGALSLQVDMTATPRDSGGAIFPQTISDYPLAEAIHQGVVKRPVIPDAASEKNLREKPGEKYSERFADYINLGVTEWRKTFEQCRRLDKKSGKKAVLFLMTDDTRSCDELGEYLQRQYSDLAGKVLVIHTKPNGEISEAAGGKNQKELAELRKQAATIDDWDNPYRAVVSVLVLREGWDVRNVTTIVGLRAYTARGNILPEQTLGRGLRLMYPEQPDGGEVVSVIGTRLFLNFVKEIENEGVKLEQGAMNKQSPPRAPTPIRIDRDNPDKDIAALDIHLPRLSPRYVTDSSGIGALRAKNIPRAVQPYKNYPEHELHSIVFRDIWTGDVSHTTKLSDNIADASGDIIAHFTSVIVRTNGVRARFYSLYGVVREFIRDYLFGKRVDLEDPNTLRNLSEPAAVKAVSDGFAGAINTLITQTTLKAEVSGMLKVSDMPAFPMKTPRYSYAPRKCAQNLIGENYALEVDFARFLDGCADVAAFAKNYFAVNFRLDYVNAEGRIANYYPDFLVRDTAGGLWIAETKGREDDNDKLKKARLFQWRDEVQKIAPKPPVNALWVTEEIFRKYPPRDFAALVKLLQKPAA